MRRHHYKKEHVLFLGTYVPEECGIATFTRDLYNAVRQSDGHNYYSCAAVDRTGKDYSASPEVCCTIRRNTLADYLRASRDVNKNGFSMISVQHEYGIFGGRCGEYLLAFLENMELPVVTTLHTLSTSPSMDEKEILQQLCALSDAMVVMSKTAESLLEKVYQIRHPSVHIVHHGVPDISELEGDEERERNRLGLADKKILSTFGLISKGKGIEYVIFALPEILSAHPDTVYLVIGKTHPAVLASEKESYRESLEELAEKLNVSHAVHFVNEYLTLDQLMRYLRATHIYITPYLNPNQIVSGTLAYAMGCGKAVVSTPYLYAKEMLSHGRGMLVPYKNPPAIAGEVNYVLSRPEALKEYERRAYSFGKNMVWGKVGRAYQRVFENVLARSQWPAVPHSVFNVPQSFHNGFSEDIALSEH